MDTFGFSSEYIVERIMKMCLITPILQEHSIFERVHLSTIKICGSSNFHSHPSTNSLLKGVWMTILYILDSDNLTQRTEYKGTRYGWIS